MNKYFVILFLFFIPVSLLGQNVPIGTFDVTLPKDEEKESDNYFMKGMIAYEQGLFEDAISYFTKSKEHFEKSNLRELFSGYEMYWIANCYYKLGDEEKAREICDVYMLEPLSRFEFFEADSILCLSEYFISRDSVDLAINKIQECLLIAQNKGKKGRFWMSNRLPDIVKSCIEKDREKEALEFSLLSLGIQKEFYADSSINVIRCYYDLFGLYERREDYHNAIKYGQELASIAKGSNHVAEDVYPSLIARLAYCMSKQDILSYSQRIRDYIKESIKTSETLRLFKKDQYVDINVKALMAAENLHDKNLVVELCETLLPTLRSYYLLSENICNSYYYVLDCLAYNYSDINTGKDVELLEELLNVSSSRNNHWHLTAISKLLSLYCDLSEYGKAQDLFDSSKEMINEYINSLIYSGNNEDIEIVALFFYRLAWYNSIMGLKNRALVYGEYAFYTFIKADEKSQITMQAGLDLIGYYYSLGYWQDAKKLCFYLSNIILEDVSNKHIEALAPILVYMARLEDDKEKSIKLLFKAFRLSKDYYGDSHYNTLKYKFEVGYSLYQIGRFEEGLSYMESSIDSLASKWNNKQLIVFKRTLAQIYRQRGDYDYGILAEKEYLANSESPIEERLESHVIIASWLTNPLSDTQECLREIEKIDLLQKDWINITHSYYLLNQQAMKINSSAYYTWHEYVLPQMAYNHKDDSIIAYLYNSRLQINNQQSLYETKFKREISQGTDSVKALYLQYIADKNLLYKYNEEYGHNSTMLKIDSIQKKIREIESELLSYYQKKDHKETFIEWEQIRDALSSEDMAIEFIEIHDSTTIEYAALVLKRDDTFPHLIPLCTIKNLAEAYHNRQVNDSLLYSAIWKPLELELVGVNKIYFSASGFLNYLPIENLSVSNGQILSDLYELYRLSSTEEILNRQGGRDYHTAALFGGIDYETSNNQTVKKSLDNQFFTHRSFISRSLPDSLMSRGGFEKLAESLLEVKDIRGSLGKRNISVLLFTDSIGTEKSLKDLSGQEINIMHFATHGMYMYPEEAEQRRSANNFKFISTREADTHYTTEDKALTRSFLVMAGGNKLLRRDIVLDEEDDGVLTALEIYLLDFRNFDLVVL